MGAGSGPRFSTDGREIWKWDDGSTCVSSTCLEQAARQSYVTGGKHCFGGPVCVCCVCVCVCILITARIMPTPGTEVAKASLADSSLVCHSSVTRLVPRAGQSGNGQVFRLAY